MISIYRHLFYFFVAIFGLSFPALAQNLSNPNVILIVADDLGWNDVGYHGSEIATPNLDALQAGGVELDRFYTAPMCSPTRAGLLTGRYPIHFGLQRDVINVWDSLSGLPPEALTIPEIMAQAGYTRRALIGKWHLGNRCLDYHPLTHGFTEFYGFYNGQTTYFEHLTQNTLDWHRDYDPSYDAGYATDLFTAEALRFIEDSAEESPFFLMLTYSAPHTPLEAPEPCIEPYQDIVDEERRIFAGMVGCMDASIGQVVAKLDSLNLRNNTLLLFMSDNGGQTASGADNTPLKGGKGTAWEGAIRVPAFVNWPGGLRPRRVTEPVAYIDIAPTLARVVGLTYPAGTFDGVEIYNLMRRGRPLAPRSLYVYRGPEDDEDMAVVQREWKLVRIGPNLLTGEPATTQELFQINLDPTEATDVSAQYPEKVTTMLAEMATFRALQPDWGVDPDDVKPPGWKAPFEWLMVDCPWLEILPLSSPFAAEKAVKPTALPLLATNGGVYPNPFSQEATYTLTLPQAAYLRVQVVDVLGRTVSVLHEGLLPADVQHRFTLSATGLANGLYHLVATADRLYDHQTVLLVR
jgi:arylsulfatase B